MELKSKYFSFVKKSSVDYTVREFGTNGLITESRQFANLYFGVFIIDTTSLAGLPSLCTLIKPYYLPGKLFVGIKLVITSLSYSFIYS